MKLNKSFDSDRAWIWCCPCDFADEMPKSETLAVRFASAESKQLSWFHTTSNNSFGFSVQSVKEAFPCFNFTSNFIVLDEHFYLFVDANKFKEAFEEAQRMLEQNNSSGSEDEDENTEESDSEESEDDGKAVEASVDTGIVDKMEELKVAEQEPTKTEK